MGVVRDLRRYSSRRALPGSLPASGLAKGGDASGVLAEDTRGLVPVACPEEPVNLTQVLLDGELDGERCEGEFAELFGRWGIPVRPTRGPPAGGASGCPGPPELSLLLWL